MTKVFVLIILTLVFAGSALTQSATPECPPGRICFSQQQANEIFDKLSQLASAKDLIIKYQNERLTSDSTIANALKVIEGWKEMDAINGQIILKKDQVIALYERVIQLQMNIIESLEKRLMKPKSAFNKFMDALKTVTFLLAGVALGRGI